MMGDPDVLRHALFSLVILSCVVASITCNCVEVAPSESRECPDCYTLLFRGG